MRMSQLVPPKFGGNQPSQVAGTIRPGIRRLTAKGRDNPEAVRLYQQGLRNGDSFKAISASILKATNQTLTTPSNASFFSVREGDFVVKQLAQMILAKYGEDEEIEGVAVRVVKSLPIHLYGDTVEENLDYGYKSFDSSGLNYWSEEATQDEPQHGIVKGDIACRQFRAPLKQANGSAVRQPGGRVPVTRRKCEPGSCPEFQSKACQLKGKLFFYVDGIDVGAPLVLPIGSATFGSQTEKTLDDLRATTNGNLTRFERPIFFLTKELDENFPTVDDAGKPKRVKQFITKLVTMVNIPKLRMQNFDATTSANAAVLALGGTPVAIATEATAETTDEQSPQSALNLPKSQPAQDLSQAALQGVLVPPTDTVKTGRSLQLKVSELAKSAAMSDLNRFKAYANLQFGAGWGSRVDGCESAITLLADIAKPRAALVDLLAKRSVTLDSWIVDDPEPPFWDFTLDGINERLLALAE